MEVIKEIHNCGCSNAREYGISHEMSVYGGFSKFALSFIVKVCDKHINHKSLLYNNNIKNYLAYNELNTPDGKKWYF